MASGISDRHRQRGSRHFLAVGLLLVALGMALLVLPGLDQALRIGGAVAVLLGVVLTGSHLVRRLKAEMATDGLVEPGWRKPAHGSTGDGTLPDTSRPTPASAQPAALDPMPAAGFPSAVPVPGEPAPPLASHEAAKPPLPVQPVLVAEPPVSAAAPAEPVGDGPVWTPELFDQMTPRQFEAVCEALFAQGGFETRCQSHGAEGGVTLWLYSRHSAQARDTPVALARCKQWAGQPLGVRELHPLLEVMQARQLKRGTYATSSSYTENARKFAKYHGINALDRTGLLGLIAGRTPAQQQALLALASLAA